MNTYRKEVITWLDREDWTDWHAVTLTLRQHIKNADGTYLHLNEQQASQNLRHFLNRLNKTFYGTAFYRHNKRVEVIPAYEYGKNRKLHYHLALQKPIHIADESLRNHILVSWTSTTWGLWEMDLQPIYDSGWLEYITKDTFVTDTKRNENIDYENLWIAE